MDSGSSRILSIAAVLLGIVSLFVAFSKGQVLGKRSSGDDSDSVTPSGTLSAENLRDGDPGTEAVSMQPDASGAGASDVPSMAQARVQLPRVAVPADKDALEAEATFVVEELLDAYEEDARALHVSAMLNAQLHNTQQAQESWEKCVELEPDIEVFYVNLAAIALDRGDAQAAVDTLRKAMSRGISSTDILHHLGIALLSTGDANEAAEVAQQVLDTNPNAGAHWLILGQAQLKLGETQAAESSLKNAIALGVTTKPAYFALLNATLRNGKREEAMEVQAIYQGFQEEKLAADERYQVLSKAEALRVCLSTLGESAALYQDRQEFETAEHLYLRMLALQPDHKSAINELAAIYQAQGDTREELAVYERLTEVDSLNLLNYLYLAKAASGVGQNDRAEAAIKLAISMSPETVTGYAAMAEFLLEDDQAEKALWYLRRAVRLKPSQEGFRLLARALRSLGREREALEVESASRSLGGPNRQAQ